MIVILYNLGSLNFVERTRDYATLQVLGFSKKNLQNITLLENILTTMIGWILGIPMGIWFLNQYIKTFSSIRLEFIPYANWQVLLIATLLVWFTSIGTTILFTLILLSAKSYFSCSRIYFFMVASLRPAVGHCQF